MYGKTASASHFITRTGSHSTKGSRRGFVDVETGVSPLEGMTTLQVRDSLLRARAAAAAAAIDTNRPITERNEARQRVFSMSLKIDKLKKKIKMDGLPDYFMQHAKAALPEDVYKELVDRAKQDWGLAKGWANGGDA